MNGDWCENACVVTRDKQFRLLRNAHTGIWSLCSDDFKLKDNSLSFSQLVSLQRATDVSLQSAHT